MNSIIVLVVAALALANAGVIGPIGLVGPVVGPGIGPVIGVPAVAANSAQVIGPDGGKIITNSVVTGGVPVVQPVVKTIVGSPLGGIVGPLGLVGPVGVRTVVTSPIIGKTILV